MTMAAADSPAAALAQAIAKLAKSPMLAMSGHAGTLKILVEYLADQQRRIAGLEEAVSMLKTQSRGGFR